MTMLNWNQLIALPCWIPLSDLPYKPASLGDYLYKLNTQMYGVAVPPFKRPHLNPNAPHLTIVLWAPSDLAAQRAINYQIELDDGIDGEPPIELMNGLTSRTYRRMLKEMKRDGKNPLESASYRVIPDGLFIHRKVSTGPLEFYFRSNTNRDEPPYGIAYRLIDSDLPK